jgi:hypothetical protein
VPPSFRIDRPTQHEHYDVVFAGEWTRFGGPQKSMIEEIRSLRAIGLKVGILHLHAARFMGVREPSLCAAIQSMINRGEVARLVSDDVATADLVFLRYPPVLQFAPDDAFALQARRLVIVANQAPTERDGTDARYDVRQCADAAERLFGIRGTWAPQGPTVREAIAADVPTGELAPFDIPGVLDPDEWATDRRYARADRPVIGRHSRDDTMKWPESAEAVLDAYPTDGAVDVRIMGGASTPCAVLGLDRVPASWVGFAADEMGVREFLNSIDFFVYFQHTQAYDAFGRAVLEALAAGCVAILPDHFEPVFGDAALYAEPGRVRELVDHLHAEPELFREQADRAMLRVRERFSYETYRSLVATLLADEVPAPPPAAVEHVAS